MDKEYKSYYSDHFVKPIIEEYDLVLEENTMNDIEDKKRLKSYYEKI